MPTFWVTNFSILHIIYPVYVKDSQIPMLKSVANVKINVYRL
jgi:hypothetical protein